MADATDADLEKAFTAGFDGKHIELDKPSAELNEDEILAAAIAAETQILDPKAAEVNPNPKIEKDTTLDDEWEGVPQVLRDRFEHMTADLAKVQNIANSASGRANKLQGQLDKRANEKTLVPAKPTSDQLLEAMTSSTAREKLGDDFPEFAVVLDEMDKSVSTSVGSAMDKLREQMQTEARTLNASAMQDFEIKRTLDNKHPGWETTVQGTDFKLWAYKGGPSVQESDYYDNLVFQANQSAPSQKAAMFDNAQRYFNTMIDKHPIWARDKGSLYGDPSGEAAISLLDLYEKDKPPVQATNEPAPAQQLDDRFEQNLAPTTGHNRQAPATNTADVEKAFSDGFNS